MLDMPGVSSDLNVRHLQDWLTFERAWLKPSTRRSLSQISSPPSSPKAVQRKLSSTGASNTTSDDNNVTLIPFSFFILFQLRSLTLNADLSQAIGVATIELGDVCLSSRTVPGDASSWMIQLGTAKARSDGRLVGDVNIKELDITLATLLSTPSAVGNACILALDIDFGGCSAVIDYEYQRILLLDLETIRAQLNDRWSRFGQLDASADLRISVLLERLECIISTKTIPVLLGMADKINNLVQEKRAIVRTLFPTASAQESSPSVLSSSSSSAEATPTSAPMDKGTDDGSIHMPFGIVWPISTIDISVGQVRATVYPYHFSDLDCAQAALGDLRLRMKRTTLSTTDVQRDLNLKLDTVSLVKSQCKEISETDERMLSVAAWVERANTGASRNILSLPSADITTIARRQSSEDTIALSFTADFGGHVDIALNFGLIKYLQELGTMYKNQMKRRDAALGAAPTLAADQSKEITSAENTTTSSKTYKVIEPVRFDPKLRIMGDATPPLEWIGVQRQRIPIFLNEEVADPLENMIITLQTIYANAIALRKHGM
jgi:hypothetical protein